MAFDLAAAIAIYRERSSDPEAPHHDYVNGKFTVRVWDGMDGCWCDCFDAINVSGEQALAAWLKDTKDGTKNVAFREIDYYRIFRAETTMLYNSHNEMFRPDEDS